MARMAFDKLGLYRVPPAWQDAVDLTVLTIQSKPFSDKDVRVFAPCELCVMCNMFVCIASRTCCRTATAARQRTR